MVTKPKTKQKSSSQRGQQQAKVAPDEAVADSKDQQADDDRDSDAKSAYDAGGKGIISILRNRNRSELPHDHDHHHQQANLTLSTTTYYPIKPGAPEKTAGRKSARIQSNKATKTRGTKLITDDNDVSTSEDEAQAKGPPAKGRAAGQEAMEEEEGNPTITNVRL